MSAGQLGQIIRSGQIADWRTETQAAINRQNGIQTAGNSAGSGGSQTADIPQALALGAPRPLAPTNPGELNPTVPLQWSGVTGATYYQLAVRDLTTTDLVVNLSVNGTSHTAPPYTAGRTFRWNVTACNTQGCSANRSESWTFRTGGSLNTPQTSESLSSNAWAAASQGTKDCAITLARETGESLESAFQLVTSSGGWQQVAGSVANSAWNIIRHPILSVKAAWNGLTGQVSGVRDAVNAGNPSLACQRAVKLSGTVIGTVEGGGVARSSLGNLRRISSNESALTARAVTSIVNRSIDQKARVHILDGDGLDGGGGHRFGTGKSGKTEFPKNWNDNDILTAISDIARDANSRWGSVNNQGRTATEDYRNGILIKVVYDVKLERIVTGYPLNTPRNP